MSNFNIESTYLWYGQLRESMTQQIAIVEHKRLHIRRRFDEKNGRWVRPQALLHIIAEIATKVDFIEQAVVGYRIFVLVPIVADFNVKEEIVWLDGRRRMFNVRTNQTLVPYVIRFAAISRRVQFEILVIACQTFGLRWRHINPIRILRHIQFQIDFIQMPLSRLQRWRCHKINNFIHLIPANDFGHLETAHCQRNRSHIRCGHKYHVTIVAMLTVSNW